MCQDPGKLVRLSNFFDPTCWQKRPIFLQEQLKDLQEAPQITAL